MVDVILASDNVTVLGGPSSLEVDLNIGSPGTRGSLFFTGIQNPNTLNTLNDFPVTPIIFDIFINSNSSSDDYLQAYQYISQDGENVWLPVFKLRQDVYTINSILNFENGIAQLDVNLFDIGLRDFPFDSNSSENSFAHFSVQATIRNSNMEDPLDTPKPIAFSTKVGNPYFENEGSFDPSQVPLFLPITFNAVQFVEPEAWQLIDEKNVLVSLAIYFADPNQIFEFLDENIDGES
jgi:hypothetical protein